MKPIISVKNLSKKFQIREHLPYYSLRDSLTNLISGSAKINKEKRDFIWALKDISFDVFPGEVIGIIGRNGSGKSTLLKILSQITPPTSGTATLEGRVASLLEVGTGFHPELTGRENIFLNGAILGLSQKEIKSKFDEIVDFAEIEKFLDTPVKHYSSGMYMRLAFAIAAHLEPEILLVDEVLAVGDTQFQRKCLGKMEDIGKRGKTVIFISHNMTAINKLCQSCLLLERGKIKKYGKNVNQIINTYIIGDLKENKVHSEWVNTDKLYYNNFFYPKTFRLLDKNGIKVIRSMSNISEVWVEIIGEVKNLNSALTIGYAIYNQEGILLYWSYQTDSAKQKYNQLKSGKNILRSKIPQGILNHGSYRIELIGGIHSKQWFFEPMVDAPSVFVNIEGKLSNSPFWSVKRPGILAPVLTWQIKND